MNKEQIKYSLIILGMLDIVSFLRAYKSALYMWDNVSAIISYNLGIGDKINAIWIPILNLVLFLLLLASGLLLILRKRIGIIIYYIEFPLRILFAILTFGFILKLFALQFDSWSYKVLFAFIGLLELLRLVYSIWLQRTYFKSETLPSSESS